MELTRREFGIRTALLGAMHVPLLAGGAASAQESEPVRLRHLKLRANNLDEMSAFYRDVLSLPVEWRDQGTIVVTAGASTIEFTHDARNARPFYHFAFTIPENRLDAAMEWLSPRCPILNIRNTPEKTIHFRNWNAHACYFFDPAGNICEFIAHHDLDNGTSEAFGPEHLLHVSEIGLVVPDVSATEKELSEALGLKAYRGSSKTFAPLGDIYGLLITVPKNRIWLPTTDVPAEVFPTEVSMTGIGAGRYTFDEKPYAIRRANN